MFNVLKMMITVCVCVSVCVLEYMFTPHTLSQWIFFPSFVFPLSCFSSRTFLLISSSPVHLHDSFLVFLYSFSYSLFFPCLFGFRPGVYFCCLIQSRSDRKITNAVFFIRKANTSLSIFLILPEAWLAGVNTHKHALPATAYFAFATVRRGGWGGKRRMREGWGTDLFDAVWVDGGLRLQDADRLCLLGALRHLPHLLSDEVVDTVERFHRPLD